MPNTGNNCDHSLIHEGSDRTSDSIIHGSGADRARLVRLHRYSDKHVTLHSSKQKVARKQYQIRSDGCLSEAQQLHPNVRLFCKQYLIVTNFTQHDHRPTVVKMPASEFYGVTPPRYQAMHKYACHAYQLRRRSRMLSL